MDIRFAQDLCENVMLSLIAKDIGHKIASRISALTGNVRNCGETDVSLSVASHQGLSRAVLSAS